MCRPIYLGNAGELSDSVEVDLNIPPSAVSELTVTDYDDVMVTLTWLPTGDDDDNGTGESLFSNKFNAL